MNAQCRLGYKGISSTPGRETTMSCTICCETYNKTTRLDIKCQYCDLKACRSCVERYLVDPDRVAEAEPTCMNRDCKKPWIHEFLSSVMTRSFMMTKYKKHREEILFHQEVSYLPATQIEVERELKCEEIELKISKLRLQIAELSRDHHEIKWGRDAEKEKDKTRGVFIRACPSNDCRGFLSSQWKCGLCKVQVCKDCHEIIKEPEGEEGEGEVHVCDPNTLASAKALSKDSKPCPKCACLIFKIDGCDQMFCTQCHTAFSWSTHQIVTGRIHNPHYYEWLRANAKNGEIAREPGDEGAGPCPADGVRHLPTLQAFQIRLNSSIFHGREQEAKIFEIHRGLTHIELVEMIRPAAFAALTQLMPDVQKNMDLRKKYLRKEISEEDLKIQLQRREKKQALLIEINNVYQMVTQVGIEHMGALVRVAKKRFAAEVEPVLVVMEELRVYANTCFTQIAKRFNSVAKVIGEDWH